MPTRMSFSVISCKQVLSNSAPQTQDVSDRIISSVVLMSVFIVDIGFVIRILLLELLLIKWLLPIVFVVLDSVSNLRTYF